jgi:hypothetical protein
MVQPLFVYWDRENGTLIWIWRSRGWDRWDASFELECSISLKAPRETKEDAGHVFSSISPMRNSELPDWSHDDIFIILWAIYKLLYA